MSKYSQKQKKKQLKSISYDDDKLLSDLLNGDINWDKISQQSDKLKSAFIEQYKDRLK